MQHQRFKKSPWQHWQAVAVALMFLGSVLLGFTGLGNLAEAHRSSLSVTTMHTQISYQNGIQAYHQGNYPQALSLLNHAHAENPNSANVRYYLAIVLDKLSQPAKALPHYQYVSRHGSDPQVVRYATQRSIDLQPEESLAALNSLNVTPFVKHTVKPTIKHTKKKSRFSVPLKPHKNALMVEATLNNTIKGTFILDTGATYTSISQELYEQLDPSEYEHIGSVHITTANGRIEVPKIRIHTVSLEGVTAHDVDATIIQVRRNSSFSGLLGLSFLKKFELTINPQAETLVFKSLN